MGSGPLLQDSSVDHCKETTVLSSGSRHVVLALDMRLSKVAITRLHLLTVNTLQEIIECAANLNISQRPRSWRERRCIEVYPYPCFSA